MALAAEHEFLIQSSYESPPPKREPDILSHLVAFGSWVHTYAVYTPYILTPDRGGPSVFGSAHALAKKGGWSVRTNEPHTVFCFVFVLFCFFCFLYDARCTGRRVFFARTLSRRRFEKYYWYDTAVVLLFDFWPYFIYVDRLHVRHKLPIVHSANQYFRYGRTIVINTYSRLYCCTTNKYY